MARNGAGPARRRSARSRALREEFDDDVRVLGDGESLNQALEKAGRVADFFELAELMCRRRAAPRGVVRRALPRGAPDAGRRGAARRRRTSPTWPPGSTRPAASPTLHKEPLEFEYVQPRAEELQVMASRCSVWRQAGPERGRAASSTYDAPDVSEDMSFLEMLDVLNERLIAEGRRADRLRARLPRGHLRHVRDHDQRPGARAAARHGDLPAAHAQVHRRRRHHDRAVARRRPSRWSRTSSSTARAFDRIIEAGGYISVADRQRAGREPDRSSPRRRPTAAMDAAACIGCGACVAACPNGAGQLFTVGEGRAPQPAAPGPAGARAARIEAHGRARWSRTSAPAPTTASARRRARRRSRSTSSRMMNRDYLKARRKERS